MACGHGHGHDHDHDHDHGQGHGHDQGHGHGLFQPTGWLHQDPGSAGATRDGRSDTRGGYWSIILRWIFHLESVHALQFAP